MTTNQIAYWRNQEEIRHNKKSEDVEAVKAAASSLSAQASAKQAEIAEKKSDSEIFKNYADPIVKGFTGIAGAISSTVSKMPLITV